MRISRLDGLRGIAILLVVLGENNVVDLGWTGVELFFVLSGFVMTAILRTFASDNTYWSRFYFKRALRVLPLFVLVILVNKLATQNLSLIGVVGYAVFLGNVVGLTTYARAALGVLGSIAIGAQFLVVWSVAVRFFSRRTLLIIAAVLLVVEPVLRHLYTPHSDGFMLMYNLTPFRMDSLVAGSLLALLVEDKETSRHLSRWSGWAALTMLGMFLLVSYLCSPWFVRAYNTVLYNTTAYSTLAAIYFFFVAWTLSLKEGNSTERLFSWAPMVFLGRISYGLYLFHPFVNAILKRLLHLPFGTAGEAGNRKIFPIAILLSICIAALLYHFIEVPVRAWSDRRSTRIQVEHGDLIRTEEDAIALQV